MRILIVHSFYQVSGGEDSVFKLEADLLKHSNSVEKLSFYNRSGFKGALQFLLSIWNIFSTYKAKNVINRFKPDIIHLHNWHYALGPFFIRTANKKGIPVIITLHNYRLLCPSGSLMDNGHVFINSLKADFPWEAVRRKVFRDSYIMTFWLAFVVWFHKKIGTWNLVDRYIVLTDFAKKLYISSTLGIDSSKFHIKPNFVNLSNRQNVERKPFFLYIGRLSEEKGTEVLLSAFENCEYNIKIAGDGPLVEKVKQASYSHSNIEYLGVLGKSDVLELMQQCSSLLFPSIWYEGMPMVILEAFSLGTPVIASNFGVMASLVQHRINGVHYDVNDSVSLVKALNEWQDLSDKEKNAYSCRALDTYKQNYTPEANYKFLMDIYNSVINKNSFNEKLELTA